MIYETDKGFPDTRILACSLGFPSNFAVYDGKVTVKVQKNEKSFPKICKCRRKCVILHPHSTNKGRC